MKEEEVGEKIVVGRERKEGDGGIMERRKIGWENGEVINGMRGRKWWVRVENIGKWKK